MARFCARRTCRTPTCETLTCAMRTYAGQTWRARTLPEQIPGAARAVRPSSPSLLLQLHIDLGELAGAQLRYRCVGLLAVRHRRPAAGGDHVVTVVPGGVFELLQALA